MDRADALLALLDDPDPAVRAALSERLLLDAELRDSAWEACTGRGIEPPGDLLAAVLQADTLGVIEDWTSADRLEQGWAALARLHQPRRDHEAACAPLLDALASRAPRGDPGAVARWLGEDCGFGGDREGYDDPRNSHLPELLERRAGLPIALTGLWRLVCDRLGLATRALTLPGHVFAAWEQDGVLHCWDLFSGRAAGRDDLDAWARTHGAGDAGPFLAGASDRELLRRMARNLTAAYARRDDMVRAAIAAVLARG